MDDKNKEMIRIQQPDGSFKVVFRDRADNKNIQNKVPEKKKPDKSNERYFNPLNPEHVDIFGKDLIGRDIIITMLNNEKIKGKLTGYGQYDVLVNSNGKNIILMKAAIIKIEFE